MWWRHGVVGQPLWTYIAVAAIFVAAFLCGALVKLVYRRILAEIAENDPDVLKEPKPAVYFTEFGESSLDLLFFYWIANYRDQLVITDRMNVAIHRRFTDENV